MNIKTIRGFHDVMAPEIWWWNRVEAVAQRVFEAYGYNEIRVPILERTDLFARSIGTATDIVEKEMYTFEDRNGDSLALRPEGTAGVVRAYLQAGLHAKEPVARLWYGGPMFRHEKPQKGRNRQFYQVGVEALGISSPRLDAELISMLDAFLVALGIEGVTIELNSLGDAVCRPAYREKLVAFLQGVKDELCEDCRRRVDTNPLRVLDCKKEHCQALTKDAPLIIDHLCEGCQTHFDTVRSTLDVLEVSYQLNKRIVRGLDYYVRTAFELLAGSELGSQKAVGGGGRYDGLVGKIGGAEGGDKSGPDQPGVGVALGVERLVMVLEEQQGDAPRPSSVYVVSQSETALDAALALAGRLRAHGVRTELDYEKSSMKAQLRRADRRDAQFAVILGDDELERGVATVRSLDDGTQNEVADHDLVEWIAHRLESD